MDIAGIQAFVKSWVKTITSLPAHWENQPDNTFVPKLTAKVVLTGPMNIVPVGIDYVQWADAGSGMMQPTVIGHREFDIAVRVVSRSQDGNRGAQFWLETLRAALKRPSAIDAFSEAGLAVLTMSAGVQYDAPFEERVESIASATWHLTGVIADADDAQITALTTVELTSNIEGEDGSVLTVPPNVTNELITG